MATTTATTGGEGETTASPLSLPLSISLALALTHTHILTHSLSHTLPRFLSRTKTHTTHCSSNNRNSFISNLSHTYMHTTTSAATTTIAAGGATTTLTRGRAKAAGGEPTPSATSFAVFIIFMGRCSGRKVEELSYILSLSL